MSDGKNMFSAAGRTARPQRAKAGERTQAAAVEEESVYHSARVPLSLSKEIKKLALEENTSQQALTVEALRLLLESRK